MTHFLLIHSPLLGPSSWAPTGRALQGAGHSIVVPDLRGFTAKQDPADGYLHDVKRAAGEMDGPAWVVGHSGAGAVIPAAANAMPDCIGAVFVDAVIPPRTGPFSISEQQSDFLNGLASDGYLPKWTDWWPDEIRRLVPDTNLLATLEADVPSVPMKFYETPIRIPKAWEPPTVAYVQLSHAYDEQRAEASRRGWSVVVAESTHLGLVTDPDSLAETLANIATESAD